MVHLILSSTKGNQGLRYFPYSGYLGLTPIRVEGIVRTKLDADLKGLQAKSISISVRCYESRTGRVNVLHSNVLVDYTQVLWTKPDGVDSESIGNLEFPFRMSIPAKVAGFSTAIFVDYRCIWRVEAVLSHVPISGVGSRQIRHFELPLVRYDLPPFATVTPSPEPFLSQEITKPRAPRIRYSTHPPKTPIGPLDLVSIPIHLQPLEHGVSIRSASVIVERRIFLHDIPHPSTPVSLSSLNTPSLNSSHSSSSLNKSSSSPHLQPSFPSSSSSYSPTHSYQEPEPEPASSTASFSSSNPTLTPGTIYPSALSIASETANLLPNSPPSSSSSVKVIVNPIAGVESSGNFARDANGIWSKTLTLQWPAAKSHSRWAIGETISSELVSVKYFIRSKIIVTSPSGTETVELADQELLVVSTNEAERQLALSKYNEMQDAMVIDGNLRSKSKSPRRSRPEREDAIPPSPGVNNASYGRSKSSSRRPHTSAGPRDKPVNFAGGAYGRPRGQEGEALGQTSSSTGTVVGGGSIPAAAKRRSELVVLRTTRPDSSHSVSKQTRGGLLSGNGPGKASSNSFWSTVHSNGVAPRMKGAPSGSSTSTTGSSSSVSSSSHGNESDPSDHMREWEEELARIEVRSRRSSDLLGFSGKRKRSAGAPRVVVPRVDT
ncbi:hypothetical protein GALMADRAFT_152624 [Galerina marginata CBS 339.88]|uniref:Uncharacterized protein n=1 Tax=Galerina marginata (strain CBS 339.88) TaxID=685588 RepID=A0A067TF01_GALM3|nr:hypothetical protein GALMADRAFT_152624 [Galerina marginata CBS 339.88]